MPEIGRIQSTNFQSLLTELGITRNNIPFALRSEVTPVVLVGGTVSFLAAPTPAYQITDLFTIGRQTNPAAGTVLADTGPLPAGAYSLKVFLFETVTNQLFDFEWRDAANAANLYTTRLLLGSENLGIWEVRFDIQNDNERFRVSNVSAPGAGNDVQATIMARI